MVVVIDIEHRIGVQENNIIRLDTLIPVSSQPDHCR